MSPLTWVSRPKDRDRLTGPQGSSQSGTRSRWGSGRGGPGCTCQSSPPGRPRHTGPGPGQPRPAAGARPGSGAAPAERQLLAGAPQRGCCSRASLTTHGEPLAWPGPHPSLSLSSIPCWGPHTATVLPPAPGPGCPQGDPPHSHTSALTAARGKEVGAWLAVSTPPPVAAQAPRAPGASQAMDGPELPVDSRARSPGTCLHFCSGGGFVGGLS